MIYLASPYSHPDPAIRQERFEAACKAVAIFLRAGQAVFSPIVHSHHLVDHGLPATDWDFWEAIDRQYLALCSEVWVLQLDGWEKSRGVRAEIKLAEEMGLPVRFVQSVA